MFLKLIKKERKILSNYCMYFLRRSTNVIIEEATNNTIVKLMNPPMKEPVLVVVIVSVGVGVGVGVG
ncbi:MAG: hypothetical protein EAX90_14210, partial [Candidatus Heimdallarchaeota archaeon]|nr:hypothetical protein [Candidatus Heimdallarchaeota archaeon]